MLAMNHQIHPDLGLVVYWLRRSRLCSPLLLPSTSPITDEVEIKLAAEVLTEVESFSTSSMVFLLFSSPSSTTLLLLWSRPLHFTVTAIPPLSVLMVMLMMMMMMMMVVMIDTLVPNNYMMMTMMMIMMVMINTPVLNIYLTIASNAIYADTTSELASKGNA